MKTPIRKSVPHFRIVSHISRLSANFRVSTFQVLVDPGRSWLALIGLGWSQDTWAWSWNALQHPETPWNTLKHLVQSCPEMWDTMDLNWCPTFQDLVYPMVYLCNFPAVLCTMGKPLFPLRPSGAQKPLSDGSDGDIRGGTLQQNQGHLDMPTESFSCTQEKTIFEDQKIAQGRAGW